MENKLICVIRIKGKVGLRKEVKETLKRLRLEKKYACIVFKGNAIELGMVNKVRDYVAFGEIDVKTFQELIKLRGRPLAETKNKTDLKKNSQGIANGIAKGKSYKESGIKGFFRLHPPRKGINSKLHYPKGVLGNHKENIKKLLERML